MLSSEKVVIQHSDGNEGLTTGNKQIKFFELKMLLFKKSSYIYWWSLAKILFLTNLKVQLTSKRKPEDAMCWEKTKDYVSAVLKEGSQVLFIAHTNC